MSKFIKQALCLTAIVTSTGYANNITFPDESQIRQHLNEIGLDYLAEKSLFPAAIGGTTIDIAAFQTAYNVEVSEATVYSRTKYPTFSVLARTILGDAYQDEWENLVDQNGSDNDPQSEIQTD